MLEELSKKDKLWRRIAFAICKNRQLADDIVQEMYLRFHRNPKDSATDFYVVLVIKSVFKNYLVTLKETSELNIYIESNESFFEPNDEEQEILDRFEALDCWRQKELLMESYDRSLREINKTYPLINYGYAYRQIKEAREQILQTT